VFHNRTRIYANATDLREFVSLENPLRAFVKILCALCGLLKKPAHNSWLIAFLPAFFVLGLLLNTSLAQQNQDYFFHKLTTSNGLSSNFIQNIFRDSRGYVWISTNYGLNRYDGTNIKVYHHDPANPHSLPRDDVRSIAEDREGILWIGADYGLIEFNPVTEQFNLHLHQPGNPKSLCDDHIPSLFIDSRDNLWVSTGHLIQRFDRKSRNFETYLLQSPDSIGGNPTYTYFKACAEDKENNIWCIYDKGLFKFDTVQRTLKFFPYYEDYGWWISDIFIDHEGNIWLGQSSGHLTLFHQETGQFEPMNDLKYTRGNEFENLGEWRDPSGVYWLILCTEQGLLLYNHSAKKQILVQSNPLNPFSLIDNLRYHAYTDQENILWIGTGKGLNILDNADQLFYSKTILQGNSFNDRHAKGAAQTIYEDPECRMISFWWAGGLGIYDNNWNLLRFYNSIPPSDTSYEAMNIYGICKDFRGFYWITTDNSLVRFDRKNNQFKVFIPPDDVNEPADDHMLLRSIIPYDSTSFYVRSRDRGIYKFDLVKEKFVQHLIHNEKDPASLPSNILRGVIKDAENRLIIISGNTGIYIYDPRKNNYEIYDHDPDVSIDDAIHNLYYDPALSGNILWINSAHGLLKFDLQTKLFELFNSRNGLANDYLISNEVDKNGNVWVAHNAGISMFDAATRTFTNYSETNGLVFQEFNSDMKKMADGNIYIGDADRLTYFNPDAFKANQNIPQVHINSVQVLNEPFKITIDSITHQKSLTLHYDQDLITVDFSVLNFTHPNENKFFFRLDEDSVWHQVNEGSVNLIRLSPGQYVLHVTGSNGSGVMNPAGDTLYINILPPYYQTWWFRILLATGVLLIFFVIRSRGINRVKHEEQLKTEFNKQLAQAETKALRAQMNPHFIFNCLNSINSFVIDQKHEIASDYLIKFSKLIRLILDNSRSETITIEKELETLRLYVLLESARYDNKFACVYNVAEDVNTNTIMIPPMLLQPFVENAIWHGLMQKEGEGTITVEIIKEDEEFLKISITDDGIGREKAAELKSKSATHKSHGLKVTSQRIDMMNKLNSTGAQVHIIDLKDDQGVAAGTKVELIIPF
jgi:ligand-binding sensor domain-containing protein